MVDGAPSYDGAASDPPCYNCGMRGHWFNACPEPTRKLPAGLEASLAARQHTRDSLASDSQLSSRRGKGPVITRYPLPPSPVPGLGRYDAPSGLPPHPPPPSQTSYPPPVPYGQPYAPPYNAHGHHHDIYGHGASPPPVSGHYNQYRQHQPHSFGPPPHSQAPYLSPHDSSREHHDNYGHPRSSQSYHYSGPDGTDAPLLHYSYPPGYDYPRHLSPYSHAPHMNFHESPPPEYRHPHFPPPHYRDGHSRDRSPRDQSRERWQSWFYRQRDEEHRYRDREYERGRPRYSPQRQTSPRQRYERERSPQHGRPPLREDSQRQDRRRDKRGSTGNNRKPEKDRGKQSQQKSSDKSSNKTFRFEKSQSSGQAQAGELKPASQPDMMVQWGLVVPYMPVWDFEQDDEEESDKPTTNNANKDISYDEDEDLEWSNSQLFAEWVPMVQSRALCMPLPSRYSEDDITPPAGYDAVLQTKHITPHNVDQFSMSIRETKEWRHKKGLPMFTDPMGIHPRMLAQLTGRERKARDENTTRNGRGQQQKKVSGNQHDRKRSQDTEDAKKPRQRHQDQTRRLSNGGNQIGRNGSNISPEKTQSPLLDRRELENKHSDQQNSLSANGPDLKGKAGHKSFCESPAPDLLRNDVDHRTDHELRLSDEAAGNLQATSHQRHRSNASKTSTHSPEQDSKDDDQITGDATRPDIVPGSGEAKAIEPQDAAQAFPPHERPFSRSSHRSWHSKIGRNSRPMSRRASIVSDVSRPESPLTPTEMALLGIDMDSDSDSEHAIDDEPESVIITKVPEKQQKRQHQDDEPHLTPKGGRPGKRQAALVSEEVTPRTKKRRQQVASAFSRRW